MTLMTVPTELVHEIRALLARKHPRDGHPRSREKSVAWLASHKLLRITTFFMVSLSAALLGGCGERPIPTSPKGVVANPQTDEVAAARAVARQYLDAKDQRSRMAFVRDPDRILPLALPAYGEGPPRYTFEIMPGGTLHKAENSKMAAYVVLRVRSREIDNPERENIWNCYLVKTSAGFKVDWEASVSYRPMGLAVYVAQRPAGPITIRVIAELSNYCNYAFAGCRGTHYSFRISDEDGTSITGYLRKDSPDAERLVYGLGQGPASVTLELEQVGPAGQALNGPSDDGAHVTIQRMAIDSWIVRE